MFDGIQITQSPAGLSLDVRSKLEGSQDLQDAAAAANEVAHVAFRRYTADQKAGSPSALAVLDASSQRDENALADLEASGNDILALVPPAAPAGNRTAA